MSCSDIEFFGSFIYSVQFDNEPILHVYSSKSADVPGLTKALPFSPEHETYL